MEDCALALFSRDGDAFVGEAGDVAIFSFRKTLPVADGGAVVANTPTLPQASRLGQPPLGPVLAALMPLVGRSIRRWLPAHWDGLERSYRLMKCWIHWLRGHHRLDAANEVEFAEMDYAKHLPLCGEDRYEPRISAWTMSRVSRRIMTHMDACNVVGKRRANFQHLLEALRDVPKVELLFTELPPGVCPTVFPILTERRAELYASLTAQKIGAIEWWSGFHPAIDWSEFPEAEYLKNHVIALPVHQGLDQEDMAYIAACVRTTMDAVSASLGHARRLGSPVASSSLSC